MKPPEFTVITRMAFRISRWLESVSIWFQHRSDDARFWAVERAKQEQGTQWPNTKEEP